MVSNMKATRLLHTRVIYSEEAFAEMVVWQLTKPVAGVVHRYKYRLAYVVRGKCVLRYVNELGKGDHRHVNERQGAYIFTTPERLVADFQRDIARWNRENRDS